MNDVEEYAWGTAEDNLKNKDWGAGSRKPAECNEVVFPAKEDAAELRLVVYTQAFMKIIDEPIVNAIDQFIVTHGEDKTKGPALNGSGLRVSTIKVIMSDDGMIEVFNDGAGVSSAIHSGGAAALGRNLRIPTAIFGHVFQGSNRRKGEASITGGTNGIGAKLSNLYSRDFYLETVDAARGILFKQHWSSSMSVCDEPELKAFKGRPYTRLRFMPNTQMFGYALETPDKAIIETMRLLVRTRLVYAATYCEHVCPGKCKVYFGTSESDLEHLDARGSSLSMARLLGVESSIVRFNVLPGTPNKFGELYTYPIEVAVVMDTERANSLSLTCVNGIVVRPESTIVAYMRAKIVEGVSERLKKSLKSKDTRITPSLVNDHFSIVIIARIPDASWIGQSKDRLQNDRRGFAHYEVPKEMLDKITVQIKDSVLASILGTDKPSKKKAEEYDISKYQPAEEANGRNGRKCHLILVEGDSAQSNVKNGMSKVRSIGFKYYGIMTIGGVPINVRKECERIVLKGREFLKRSDMMKKNVFFNTFMSVTGLSLDAKYAPGSDELRSLKYGTIDVFVDQDLDGKGNILGMLISTFDHLWPNLIAAGYIRWIATPIIRAYPKIGGKVLAFYNQLEYNIWEAAQDGDVTSSHEVKYFKGIGTHSDDEIVAIFKEYEQRIATFYNDERSSTMCDIYYGRDPDKRKAELTLPTQVPSRELILEQATTQRISCGDHLIYETNLYQKDNLDRKLDCLIDGFNQVGRKIYHGAHKAMKNGAEVKVVNLTGTITSSEGYHHGDASLNDAIIGRGFISVGGRQLPMFLPSGCFGTRNQGGKDAASARYIHAVFNHYINDLIYPHVDYELLQFNYDEGVRHEPRFYVPIIPMAIIESVEVPATGWKLKLWGREVMSVIMNVRRMIHTDNENNEAALLPMPPCVQGWKGNLVSRYGSMYSVGTYVQNGNTITITELPYRVWTQPYKIWLHKQRKDMIKKMSDKSNNDEINITIELTPGTVIDASEYPLMGDPIIHCFQLYDRMDDHINLIDEMKQVRMFKSYEDVMRAWFPYRKAMYSDRIDRQILLLKLRIEHYYPNLMRYIRTGISVRKLSIVEMENKLMAEEYSQLDMARLNNPGIIPTKDLTQVILAGPNVSYDYLLGMTDRAKSTEEIARHENELARLKEKLEDLEFEASRGPFRGARIWLSELDKLEDNIAWARKTGWRFKKSGKYSY